MRLITISGLDGSGKSTQIQLLKNYLESQGKRVFYFHAVNFSIANRGETSNKNKSVTKAGWFKIQLRKIALKVDLIRFKSLIAKLEKEGCDYLVSDRYFYDSLVNIEYLKDSTLPLEKGDVRLGQRDLRNKLNISNPPIPLFQGGGIMQPTIAIYLQTSPETIMQRERKPDQGLDYLQKKKEIYDKYASVWNLKIIDGDRSKEEIFENIKSLVK